MNASLTNRTPVANRRRTAPARERGLIMLLVMAALLLTLIVGLTYMEVVRQDRRSTVNMFRAADIDMVAQSVIDAISGKLKADLGLDPNTAAAEKFFFVDSGDDTEFYDYPGPKDKWLAAIIPSDVSGTYQFEQVSLIGAGFGTIASGATDTAQTLVPADAVGVSDAADADGDGITDSKMAPAPITQLRNRDYYMWVRVIDNSALLNADVALSQVTTGGAYSTTEPPYWRSPAELDLGGLAFSRGTWAPTRMTELGALLQHRMASSAQPTTLVNRTNFWQNAGRYYGGYPTGYQKLGLDSELELRHRFGLENAEVLAGIEDKTASGATRSFFRVNSSNPVEKSFKNALTNMGQAVSIPNYYTLEPRHFLTTVSGHANHAPRLSATDPAGRLWQLDINRRFITPTPSPATLAAEITKVYSIATPATLPGNFNSGQLADFANQLACNIIDYADVDNLLTTVGGRYGMEALPFIGEVYVGHEYRVTAATDAGGGTIWDVTWTKQGTAWAVELRNPFRKPILTANVSLSLNGALLPLSAMAGMPAQIAPGQVVIIRQNGPIKTDILNALGVTAPIAPDTTLTPATAASTAFDSGAAVVVKLVAKDAANVDVPYQTVTVQALEAAASYNQPAYPAAADPTNVEEGYFQRVVIGNGSGLNALTVTDAEFQTHTGVNYTVAFPSPFNATLDAMPYGTKVGQGTVGGHADKCAPANNQFVFSDSGVITHIGEIAHVAIIGPTTTTTVADAWGPATAAAQFIPDFTSANVVGSTELALPHATLLMDRLTTMSASEDGVDNDRDGTVDEADEQLVPGTLNINTASKELLMAALPIPDVTLRTNIVNAIINYRENVAASRPATHRAGIKGIAHLGELYNAATQVTMDAGDNRLVGGILADFLSNPLADNSQADGVTNDIEERSMLLRWLGQVCSTRSDIFTAYILVRGYGTGATTNANVERRLIVIFDRSQVTKTSDQVRILGVFQY